APTQRRRDESRRQGQVAASPDFGTGILLLAAAAALWWGGRTIGEKLLISVSESMVHLPSADLDASQTTALMTAMFQRCGEVVSFFVGGLLAVGLGAGAAQAGLYFVPELLLPKSSRLSLSGGLARMFSRAAAGRALTAFL